jgi:hypothetical protein
MGMGCVEAIGEKLALDQHTFAEAPSTGIKEKGSRSD